MRLSVNFILYVFFCGQGRALSLRYDIEFNLIAADNRHISVNYYGGSKPPPYRVGYIFSIRAKHPLLFTLHFSLPDRAFVLLLRKKIDEEFKSLFNHILMLLLKLN